MDVLSASSPLALSIRRLGLADYRATWRAMIDFTAARTPQTPDEIWLCEHPPVYTLGQAGKPEHRLYDNGIDMMKVDRAKTLEHSVIVYCKANQDKKVIQAIDIVFKQHRADNGIKAQ